MTFEILREAHITADNAAFRSPLAKDQIAVLEKWRKESSFLEEIASGKIEFPVASLVLCLYEFDVPKDCHHFDYWQVFSPIARNFNLQKTLESFLSGPAIWKGRRLKAIQPFGRVFYSLSEDYFWVYVWRTEQNRCFALTDASSTESVSETLHVRKETVALRAAYCTWIDP